MANVESIRGFINKNIVSSKRNIALNDEDDIFKMGFVNSMMALKLVTFIEDEFGVTVEDDELDVSTFSTINRISQFVEQKLGTQLER